MLKVYPSSHFPPLVAEGNLMPFTKRNRQNTDPSLFSSDAAFDWMYPEHLQQLSSKHWTPLAIATKAARFLAEPGARVLDIGSGIGKFCLAGAHHHPETSFYGVEQRPELNYFASEAKRYTQLPNAHFICANITEVNFREFDHFYFYNSFYENLDAESQIDNSIAASDGLYVYYTNYLHTVLNEKPSGTRVVTYHSLDKEVPLDYVLADVSYDTLLKMWIKA